MHRVYLFVVAIILLVAAHAIPTGRVNRSKLGKSYMSTSRVLEEPKVASSQRRTNKRHSEIDTHVGKRKNTQRNVREREQNTTQRRITSLPIMVQHKAVLLNMTENNTAQHDTQYATYFISRQN